MSTTFGENIEFLEEQYPELKQHLLRAAQLHFEDRASSEVALRKFAEHLVKNHLLASGPKGLFDSINQLEDSGTIPQDVGQKLHALRQLGNRSAHVGHIAVGDLDEDFDPIQTAYDVAAWFFVFNGGSEAAVPIYTAPTPAAGYKIFRDALIGGEYGYGDSTAKYYVALALEEDERTRLRASQNDEDFGPVWGIPSRRKTCMQYLRDCFHDVPAARSKMASMLLEPRYEQRSGSIFDPPELCEFAEQEVSEALHLLEWAAKDDDSEGLFLLGAWFLEGWHGKNIDLEKAENYLRRAAAQDHPGALNALFVLYYNRRNDGEYTHALELVRKSADMGNPLGQLHQGLLLVSQEVGCSDAHSKSKGITLLLRAADHGLGQAKFELGRMILEDQIEQPRTVQNAETLVIEAINSGYFKAMEWMLQWELGKKDSEANLPSVLGMLHTMLEHENCTNEIQTTLKELSQEVYDRLTQYLLSIDCRTERYRDLSFQWYRFKHDGTKKFASNEAFNHHLWSFESEPIGPNIENLIRARMGPQGNEAYVQATLTKHNHSQPSNTSKPLTNAKKHRKNAPCYCGSGKKHKKCCWRKFR